MGRPWLNIPPSLFSPPSSLSLSRHLSLSPSISSSLSISLFLSSSSLSLAPSLFIYIYFSLSLSRSLFLFLYPSPVTSLPLWRTTPPRTYAFHISRDGTIRNTRGRCSTTCVSHGAHAPTRTCSASALRSRTLPVRKGVGPDTRSHGRRVQQEVGNRMSRHETLGARRIRRDRS